MHRTRHSARVIWLIALIAAIPAALAGCGGAARMDSGAPDRSWTGVWKGRAEQDDGSSWTVEITVRRGTFTVEYPSLGCGARLHLLDGSGGRLTFREILTHGHDQCMDSCRIVLKRESETGAVFLGYYPDGALGAQGWVVRE